MVLASNLQECISNDNCCRDPAEGSPARDPDGRQPHPTFASSGSSNGARIDRFGAIAGGLCAVHCAVCAFLPVAFAALGLGFFVGHEAEWIFTLVAITFAVAALVSTWRRHRSALPVVLLLLGIAGLFASRGLEMTSADHKDHHAEAKHLASHLHADAQDSHTPASSAIASPSNLHFAGTTVGVAAGLLLLAGHLVNLRAVRRRVPTRGCPD